MYNASPAFVTPASTHLIPLAKTLEAALSDPMNDYVAGDVERPLKITAEASFQTWQSGKPADIIDGNSGTYAWYNGAEGVGQYYQVNFSKPTTIYGKRRRKRETGRYIRIRKTEISGRRF